MTRAVVLLPPTLWIAGIVAIALAVSSGGARFTLLLIFPVVSGDSPVLLLGVVLVFAGFLSLAFVSFAPGDDGEPPRTSGTRSLPGEDSGSAGVILIGPLPILFGRWKGNRVAYSRWAAVGVVLTLVALAVAILVL